MKHLWRRGYVHKNLKTEDVCSQELKTQEVNRSFFSLRIFNNFEILHRECIQLTSNFF